MRCKDIGPLNKRTRLFTANDKEWDRVSIYYLCQELSKLSITDPPSTVTLVLNNNKTHPSYPLSPPPIPPIATPLPLWHNSCRNKIGKFGIALRQPWIGTTMWQLRDNLETTLRKFGDSLETTLGQIWVKFGTALGQLWAHFVTTIGQLSGRLWVTFETVLRKL